MSTAAAKYFLLVVSSDEASAERSHDVFFTVTCCLCFKYLSAINLLRSAAIAKAIFSSSVTTVPAAIAATISSTFSSTHQSANSATIVSAVDAANNPAIFATLVSTFHPAYYSAVTATFMPANKPAHQPAIFPSFKAAFSPANYSAIFATLMAAVFATIAPTFDATDITALLVSVN